MRDKSSVGRGTAKTRTGRHFRARFMGRSRQRLVPEAYYVLAREGFASDRQLAAALGVDPHALSKWKRGLELDADHERLLRDFAVAVSELLTVYEPAAVPAWLQGRAQGEEKRPLDWLREGNLAEVLNQINASATGAYS